MSGVFLNSGRVFNIYNIILVNVSEYDTVARDCRKLSYVLLNFRSVLYVYVAVVVNVAVFSVRCNGSCYGSSCGSSCGLCSACRGSGCGSLS